MGSPSRNQAGTGTLVQTPGGIQLGPELILNIFNLYEGQHHNLYCAPLNRHLRDYNGRTGKENVS